MSGRGRGLSGCDGSGLSEEDTLRLLRRGRMEVTGRLITASNATFCCDVSLDGVDAACVYKPVRGERPLWDFPQGSLGHREVAAYEVSAVTGWHVVPPTVYRDGPFGPGMAQLWVEPDVSVDLMALIRSYVLPLRRMAVFDAVINNADRKGGHLLPMSSGHVYGVDHGVSFAVEDKLRTVLWQWRGRPLLGEAVYVLEKLEQDLDGGPLAQKLAELLEPAEVEATKHRVWRLLDERIHPEPSHDWPPVPWPPI